MAGGITALRAKLRALLLRRDPKDDAELAWWLDVWQAGFAEEDYEQQRWQRAEAAVARVLSEANIEDEDFFRDKIVVDIGPGPLGFPDACPARVSIGVEPLAQRFADAGLLLHSSAVYLTARAEAIPLVSRSVDVVVARNSLDHVDDPQAAIAEMRRVLRPGGTLILNFDVEHTPTAAEPHALDAEQVIEWVAPMTITYRDDWDHAHGADGHAVVLVATR